MPADDLRVPDAIVAHDAVTPGGFVPSDTVPPVEATALPELTPAESREADLPHGDMHGRDTASDMPPESVDAMAPPTAPDEPLPAADRPFEDASPSFGSPAGGPERSGDPVARQGSTLPKLLAGAIVLLLIIIAALIYAGPQLSGAGDLSAKVDALNQRVASLEARPEPPKSDVDVVALDTRSKALDSDVAALKTSLADLAAKLDAVTQSAAANAAKVTSLEQTAVAAPPAGPAPAAPASAPPVAPAAPDSQPSAPGVASQEPPASPGPPPPAAATLADLTALSGKVDDLAGRVAALPTVPPAAPASPAVDLAPLEGKIADLAQGLVATQTAVAALPKVDLQAVDQRIDGVDHKLSDTDHRLATLADAVMALPKIDLAPLQAAVTELGTRLGPVEAALSAPKAGDRVTEARGRGQRRGEPRRTARRRGRGGDPRARRGPSVHGRTRRAARLGSRGSVAWRAAGPRRQGRPTAEALHDQWSAVETDVLTASVPKSGDSVLDRFAAGARNLCRCVRSARRPATTPPRSRPGSVTRSNAVTSRPRWPSGPSCRTPAGPPRRPGPMRPAAVSTPMRPQPRSCRAP